MKLLSLLAIFLFTAEFASAGNSAREGELTSGDSHTCFLRRGEVQCWGSNEFGQSKVPALQNPRMVSAGNYHTCALDDSGVKCWGQNKFGQTNVPPLKNPRYVSAGFRHSCAIDDEGVKCWWYNGKGESQVPKLQNPRIVSAGDRRTCAIDDNGVQCWGMYAEFQRKFVNPKSVSVGSQACVVDDEGAVCGSGSTWQPKLVRPSSVVSGSEAFCALDEEGLKCWAGANGNFLRPGSNYSMPEFGNVTAFSVGEDHACAVDETGLKCWGKGYTNIPRLNKPKLVEAGVTMACAQDEEGVKCWGDYAKEMNAAMPAFQNLRALSVGSTQLCGIDEQGLRCASWGRDFNPAPGWIIGATEVKVGSDSICVTTHEAVRCWKKQGQLDESFLPMNHPHGLTFSQSGGCAMEGSQLKCWYNPERIVKESRIQPLALASSRYSTYLIDPLDNLFFQFQAGDWTTLMRKVPSRNLREFSAGEDHLCLIDDSGLSCVAGNQSLEPPSTKVPHFSSPHGLTSGEKFACALDGEEVKCWGGGYERMGLIPKW